MCDFESYSIHTSATSTIGKKLDNFIGRLNHLSSTQLYVLTVTFMALVACIILLPVSNAFHEKEVEADTVSKPKHQKVN